MSSQCLSYIRMLANFAFNLLSFIFTIFLYHRNTFARRGYSSWSSHYISSPIVNSLAFIQPLFLVNIKCSVVTCNILLVSVFISTILSFILRLKVLVTFLYLFLCVKTSSLTFISSIFFVPYLVCICCFGRQQIVSS